MCTASSTTISPRDHLESFEPKCGSWRKILSGTVLRYVTEIAALSLSKNMIFTYKCFWCFRNGYFLPRVLACFDNNFSGKGI
jgi:hypothetical protein